MSRPAVRSGPRKIPFDIDVKQYAIKEVVCEEKYGIVCSIMHKQSGMKFAIKNISPFEHSIIII